MAMNQLDRTIAVNLKRIRKSRNMSLDMLAERTGVSKSMLGQIERGESNPTVATIAKIVEGIRVSFEELLYAQEEKIEIIDQTTIPAMKREKGVYQVKSIFPFDKRRSFEVYEVEIAPAESYEDFLSTEGIDEYIMVQKGVLSLCLEGDWYEIKPEQAIRISSTTKHSFYNKGTQDLQLQIIASAKQMATL